MKSAPRLTAFTRFAAVMIPIIGILLAPSGLCAATAQNDAVQTMSFKNYGKEPRNVPITFGALFAPGDIPANSSLAVEEENGTRFPAQVDVKARNPDGSLRHAVITVVAPRLENGQEIPVRLRKAASASQGDAILPSVLPPQFDVVISLQTKGHLLSASANALLKQGDIKRWLSGPLVAEWWVSGPFKDEAGVADPHLSARFGIRSYGPGRPLRIEVDVENTWTWVKNPGTAFYDAKITANGKEVFAKAKLAQPAYTRWRQMFWWDMPINVLVKQDLAYLKNTGAIPNYSPDARISERELGGLYDAFQKSDHEPMGAGTIAKYMPTTGGRGDIAPLPSWTVAYLLSMDKRAYDVMMADADLSGSFASHYRNTRTGYPVTTEEFPNISTHSNMVGKPGQLPIPDSGGYTDPLTPQTAHEPSLDFVPYLVSGDKYYLEELEFWSQWNSWGTAAEYHGFAKGLVSWDEVRGQGWSLRTLAQAAYITPDNDPLKATLIRELKANFDFYNARYAQNPNANILHAAFLPSREHIEYSPWMDDFLTWAAGYAVDLGFDFALPFARWKGAYPVQRMANPDYCWVLATPYRMTVQNPDFGTVTNWADAYRYTFQRFAVNKNADPGKIPCGSAEMASALGLKKAGEMTGGPGYPENIQPALAAAVDVGTPQARAAWEKFAKRPVRSDEPTNPAWNIVPRKLD